jgi:hypothetical protein
VAARSVHFTCGLKVSEFEPDDHTWYKTNILLNTFNIYKYNNLHCQCQRKPQQQITKKWYLYAGNVGFTGPIGVLTVEVIGLKSAPTGAEAVVVAA